MLIKITTIHVEAARTGHSGGHRRETTWKKSATLMSLAARRLRESKQFVIKGIVKGEIIVRHKDNAVKMFLSTKFMFDMFRCNEALLSVKPYSYVDT